MAVGVVALTEETNTITQIRYDALLRDSERLRILKNFIRSESVVCKKDIIELVKAMEDAE